MNKIILSLFVVIFIQSSVTADIPKKIFTKVDIMNLAGVYLENKLDFDNPVFADVDNDGDFDALKFSDGNVEYYKNTGDLEHPQFILENRNYDKYDAAFFIEPKIPYPLFFADNDGDNDLDLFAVKDKKFNTYENKYNYSVVTASNALGLDTGTLITIILVLIIVILVLAILR